MASEPSMSWGEADVADLMTQCPLMTQSRSPSYFSAIIRPVQEGLPLALAAGLITMFAVALKLGNVAAHSVPAPDLPRILFWHSPAHIVAAIPLEPSAWIVGMNPPFLAPH